MTPIPDDLKEKKEIVQQWNEELRNNICQRLEELEKENIQNSKAQFECTQWHRTNNDGGGGEMSMMHGELFEKAGVHISTVYGKFEEEFKDKIPGATDDPQFWASGISVIIHPKNPHVPAIHMNTRMVVTTRQWFGGGVDLTPLLDYARQDTYPDTIALHSALKNMCDKHEMAEYENFKKQCNDYFYLPHRNEHRGTGGIFFDELQSPFGWEKDFEFIKDVGRTFTDVYPEIVRNNMKKKWNEEEREEQLIRRGQYVEFNLLYDRGTLFGLKTGGNINSILSSLPPNVKWP